jgi:hypothetical protein
MSKRDFLAGSGLSAIAVAVVAFSPVMATESNKQLSSNVGNVVLVSVEERLGMDPLLAGSSCSQ